MSGSGAKTSLNVAQCHANATHEGSIREDTSPAKIDVTSKSPVRDKSVVIRNISSPKGNQN